MLDFGTIVISVFVFVGFSVTSLMMLYFARKIHGKKFSISWFILSVGNVLMGWSYMILILSLGDIMTNVFYVSLVVTSMSFMISGLVIVFYEKTAEITSLKNRYKELNGLLSHIRSKYMNRQLSEEALKELYRDFMKEMIEVEVKLEGVGGSSKDADRK